MISNWVASALCYWFPSEKENIISLTTVQHVTRDETENSKIQQSIRSYHKTLDSTIVADDFILDIDEMIAFVTEEVPSQEEEYIWEEPYQILPDSPNMDDIMDQENPEKAVDTYDQFFGAEVSLPD